MVLRTIVTSMQAGLFSDLIEMRRVRTKSKMDQARKRGTRTGSISADENKKGITKIVTPMKTKKGKSSFHVAPCAVCILA